MSLIADLIRAGVDPDLVARVADEMAEARAQGAASAIPAMTARQARNHRYYENKKASRLNASEKRLNETKEDASDDVHAPPSFSPLSSPPTPPPIIPLFSSPRTSLRSDTSGRAAIDFFERFWDAYPRKTEKKSAATKFFALLKSGIDPEAIIAGALRYAASNPEPKFTKHPTTWLNRGCWDDEQLPRDGPRREEPGSFLAYAASGQWKQDLIDDEQHSSEHQSSQAPSRTDAPRRGSDRDVPESFGGDGGALLDLRVAGSGWS